MGRKKTFDEAEILAKAQAAFMRAGYEGTSLDELVTATGLLRGSLYAAFGSKRGIFLAVLKQVLQENEGLDIAFANEHLDILLIALLELAPRDTEIRQLLSEFLKNQNQIALKLGNRLLERANILQNKIED